VIGAARGEPGNPDAAAQRNIEIVPDKPLPQAKQTAVLDELVRFASR
jgi:hypothetical protein